MTIRDYMEATATADHQEITAMGIRGAWVVLRRRRPRQPITIICQSVSQMVAESGFAQIKNQMRQGMLALVDHEGRIDKYASEPTVQAGS
jgi:hypothetical protein